MSPAREVTTRRQFVLTVYGVDDGGYEDALSEATRLMNEGCFSGINCNTNGGFSFDSEAVRDKPGYAKDAEIDQSPT